MSKLLESTVLLYKLDITTAVVLMALCDISRDDGSKCYPSPHYVAWKSGASSATVYRVLDKLEARGVLEPVGEMAGQVEYQIHMDKLDRKAPYRRPRRGRPRKDDQGETIIDDNSPQDEAIIDEKYPSGANDSLCEKDYDNPSHTEKKILTQRKVFSHREKFSHTEKAQAALETDSGQAQSGPPQSKPVEDPILLSGSYDPGLMIRGLPHPFIKQTEIDAETIMTRGGPEGYKLWCHERGLTPYHKPHYPRSWADFQEWVRQARERSEALALQDSAGEPPGETA